MLSLAIKARVPVIRVHTSDLLNLPDVIQELAPGKSVVFTDKGFPPKGDIILSLGDDAYTPTRSTYNALVESERVMLLVNYEKPSPFAFEAGEVPVPKSLMEDLIGQAGPKNKVAGLLPAFNGLTLKQSAEIIRLVQARDKTLSREAVTRMRASLTGNLQGLSHVDTGLAYYVCPPELRHWLDTNKPYFLGSKDERLVPRGILFNGIPGVGKSAGAKFIASDFGVPLYRLDLAGSLGMYVGQSEGNLSRILSTLDREAPACLLLDEVEKLFAETEDEGVTARLLSQLLWWLAEHKSRVLTIMTTNNMKALPKELYRAGRIDAAYELNGLTRTEASEFGFGVLAQFIDPSPAQKKKLKAAIFELAKEVTPFLPHALVIQTVIDLIKGNRWID